MLRITDYEWWNDPKWRPPQIEIDEEGVLNDGESIRVPLMLTDSTARPTHANSIQILDRFGSVRREIVPDPAQQRVEAAYDAYEKRLTEAWRHPEDKARKLIDAAHGKVKAKPTPAPTTATDVETARLAYIARLTNAWRQG
jgi:hypothetical protein